MMKTSKSLNFELNTELELFVNVNIIVKCVEHGTG